MGNVLFSLRAAHLQSGNVLIMEQWLLGGKIRSKVVNNIESEDHSEPAKKRPRRKYSEEYLSLGFTSVGPEHDPLPVCVLCSEVLSNEALKPCKLRRHLDTKHGQYSSKPREFFGNKLAEYRMRKRTIESTCLSSASDNTKAVEVSYRVAQRIARTGKPHTIGEDFFLPAAKEMVEVMIGEKAAKKLNLISLSDNTVKRRIDDMATDVLKQLTAE